MQPQAVDSEENKVPEEPSTFPVFSTLFTLKPYLVIDHSSKSKRQMEDFLSAFNRRVDIELTYQKNLNQCSRMLEKYIQPKSQKCLSYISSAFKVDNEQRGNQAKEFAQSLKTQIIDPISELVKKYTNSLKTAQKNFKKLNKDHLNSYDNYRKAKGNFQAKSEQTEQAFINKNIFKFTSEFPQDKKTKLVNKQMQSIRSGMQNLATYKTATTQFNQMILTYQKQAAETLNQLELIQREQIRIQCDAIRKLIVCQLSMFRNIQYDLINISKQMQKIYAENDILIFKQEAMKTNNEEDKDKDMTAKVFDADRNFLAFSLKNVEGEYYNWEVGIKRNKCLRKVMELRMKELNVSMQKKNSNPDSPGKVSVQDKKTQQNDKKIQQNDKKQEAQTTEKQPKPTTPQNEVQSEWQNIPKQYLTPPFNHNGLNQKLDLEEDFKNFLQLSQIINNVWIKGEEMSGEVKTKFIKNLQKNHFMRILAYMFIEEYRIENQVVISWENHEKIGEMIKVFIENCEKFGDVFVLKGVLSLIFTYYFVENDKPKREMSELHSINQCDLWKREDFWQAAIFQSTYQQMINIIPQKSETPEQTLFRQKNLIFSQLATYCNYMVILNIAPKNVRKIVGKYCRLYKTSDDQNRNLSKMISGTAKQMKDQNQNLANNNSSPAVSPQNSAEVNVKENKENTNVTTNANPQ